MQRGWVQGRDFGCLATGRACMIVIAVGVLWSEAGFRQFLSHWSRRKRLRSLWVLVRAAGQELAKVGGASARVLPPSAALFAPRHLHASIRTSLSLHMGRIGSALAFRLWVDIYSAYISRIMCAFGASYGIRLQVRCGCVLLLSLILTWAEKTS